MAAIISSFERAPLPQRDRDKGKGIYLAIIKTITDWTTELINQHLNPSYTQYQSLHKK